MCIFSETYLIRKKGIGFGGGERGEKRKEIEIFKSRLQLLNQDQAVCPAPYSKLQIVYFNQKFNVSAT